VLLLSGNSSTLDSVSVADSCGTTVAWAVIKKGRNTDGAATAKALSCLSTTDYTSRYGNAVKAVSTGISGFGNKITYLPTGLGDNQGEVNVTFTAGAKVITVKISPGGVASVSGT